MKRRRRAWRRSNSLCMVRVKRAGRLLLGAGDSPLLDLMPPRLPTIVLSLIEDFCGFHAELHEEHDVIEQEPTWRLYANAPKVKRLGWIADVFHEESDELWAEDAMQLL